MTTIAKAMKPRAAWRREVAYVIRELQKFHAGQEYDHEVVLCFDRFILSALVSYAKHKKLCAESVLRDVSYAMQESAGVGWGGVFRLYEAIVYALAGVASEFLQDEYVRSAFELYHAIEAGRRVSISEVLDARWVVRPAVQVRGVCVLRSYVYIISDEKVCSNYN